MTTTNRKIKKNRLKEEGSLVFLSQITGKYTIDVGVMKKRMIENPDMVNNYLINKAKERVDKRNAVTKELEIKATEKMLKTMGKKISDFGGFTFCEMVKFFDEVK